MSNSKVNKTWHISVLSVSYTQVLNELRIDKI